MWLVRNRTFRSNSYIVALSDGRGCVVIDPGLDTDLLATRLAELALVPQAVISTHGHFDHIGGVAHIQEAWDVPFYLHAADERIAASANFTMLMCNVPGRIRLPKVDGRLIEGSDISFGSDVFRVLHTPGHTPGSCVVQCGSLVFSGDTFYRDSVGRNGLPGEDAEVLHATLRGLWGLLPDEAIVLPGHGHAGSFGEIRKVNEHFREIVRMERSLEDHG